MPSGSELDGGEERTPLNCDEARRLAFARFDDPPRALRSCATDRDCTAVSGVFECPDRNVRVVACSQVPVATGNEEAGLAFRQSVLAELCPRTAPNCNATAGCAATTLRCIAGSCTVRLERDDGGL
ncbi:MAG: hypothetical protein ABW252_22345 [Polyangiales bacterium]